MMSNHI